MSDLTQLLASIGGALSAQGTGNLREFMAMLAQQQAQQSDQDFKREQQTREQLFTISRDRAQRQHQKKMQARQIAAEGKRGKQERYAAEARAIYNVALANETLRGPLERHVRKLVPGLTIDGEQVPLNWNSADEVLPFLELAAESGFGSRLAGELVSREEAEQASRSAMLGTPLNLEGGPSRAGVLGAQQGAPSVPSVVQLQQQYRAAESTLGGYDTKLRVLNESLKELEATSASIPLTEYHNRAMGLGERIQALGADFESFVGSPGNAQFFRGNAGLVPSATAFRTSLGALGDSLYNAQRTKGANALAEWTPGDPGGHPIFTEGFGGGPNEAGEARWMLASPQQKVFNAAWQEKADALRQISDLDAEALPEEVQELRQRLIMYAETEGNTLELGSLLNGMRDSALSPGNGLAEFDERAAMISDVHRIDKTDMGMRIQRATAQCTALASLESLDRRFASEPAFGAALFGSPDAMAKALQAYGTPDANGNLTVGDPNEFIAKYAQSDEGLDRLVNVMLDNLYGTEDLSPMGQDDALAQVTMRGTHVLENIFGVKAGPTLSAFRRKAQQRLGNPQATFEPRNAVPELHSWDSTLFDAVTAAGTTRYGYVDYLDPKSKEAVRKDAEDFVFSGQAGDLKLLFRDVRQRFGGAYRQPSAYWVSPGPIRGEEKRLVLPERQLDAAAELGSSYSFRDLFDAYRAYSPIFDRVSSSPGRVADQALDYRSTFGPRKLPQRWAAGRENYLFGKDSFAVKYKERVAPEDRDENTLNALGYVDLMRALKPEDVASGDGGRLLVAIQDGLRGMSYTQVLSALGASGSAAEGFALDQVAASFDYEPAPSAVDRVLDPTQEIAKIEKAESELRRNFPGQYVDIKPGLAAEFEVLDEARVTAEQGRLAVAKERARKVQSVRASGALEFIGPFLNEGLRSASFESPEELGALLETISPLIAAQTSDPMQLGATEVQSAITMVSNARSLSSAIDLTFDLISEYAANRAATAGTGLPQTVPHEDRLLALQEYRQMTGEHRYWVHAVRDAFLRRSAAGEPLLQQIPNTLLAELEDTDFAKIVDKRKLTPDDASRAALYMYLAKLNLER